MKTDFSKSNFKDNLGTAAVLTATLVGIFSSLASSSDARAEQTAAMQTMDAIVVTAPRIELISVDAIVVTASREKNTLVAVN
ncbi:MAG: hypothetical protein ABI905_09735 [Betaproteobacteria bacterium]